MKNLLMKIKEKEILLNN